jgi:DNA repair protein RadC
MMNLSKVAEVQITYSSKTKASERQKVINSRSANDILKPFFEDIMEYREGMYLLMMNRANKVLGVSELSKGATSGTLCDAKILFTTALKANAHKIILAHNHPSGNLRPSQQDINLTRKINEGARLLDIELTDHLIMSSEGYMSFGDEGLIR